MILEARKSSEKVKACEKKLERKRKSKQKKPKLLKPKGKSKMPIALKTKRQG